MEKEFDTVKEMRSMREKLQKEYEKNPALRRAFERIWRKYRLTKPIKGNAYCERAFVSM